MPTEPKIEFDHHTARFKQQSDEGFAELRATCPMGFTEAHDGYWVASSYEHARRILSDNENFTVERSADGTKGGKLIPSAPHAPLILPGALDGAEHDRLRKPLRSIFSKRRITEKVGPIIERVLDGLVGDVARHEVFDFAHDFSFRLTVAVIFEFVGLEEVKDREKFILMLEDAFAIDPEAGGDRDKLASSTSPQFEEAAALVRSVVRARREQPRDDLITAMADPSTGLSEDEVVSLTLSVVLGGVRTTGASLDNIIVGLDRDRALRRTLIDDPTLVPEAVEEFLRLAAVTPLVARTVVADQQFGDIEVKAGERVAALIFSANRDEAQFHDGENVQLGRRDGMHLTFGVGMHYCLGIWLAHLELEMAVRAILAAMPDYEVVGDEVKRYELVGVNNGFVTLPVRPQGSQRME